MLHTNHLEYILNKLLTSAEEVSDINITVGHPFQVECHGALSPVYFHPEIRSLTPYHTETLAVSLMRSDKRLADMLLEAGSCDMSFALEDKARFRINIFSQRGHYSIVMRKLDNYIRSLEELQMPQVMHKMARETNGIILVTGATGSGKTTTLAAILDAMNDQYPIHVVTLEDPVEFIHHPKKATFNQRELGTDFFSFSEGLRSALRQAPKVILVGEMRDRETVEIALAAAETGHLVLSTLHTIDVASTINRIIGLFDTEEEKQIRMRLADTLRWIVSQRLLPKTSGHGRAAALEIMGSTLLIKDMIHNGETEDKNIYSAIEALRPMGFQTFDQHILDLFEAKVITEETAKTFSSRKSVVNRGIDSLKATAGEQTSDIEALTLETE